MCALVMSLTIIFNGSRLTGLTCSKAPGFWMVEHQLVITIIIFKLANVICALNKAKINSLEINLLANHHSIPFNKEMSVLLCH